MPRPEKPLEDSNRPVTRLAAELRRLRERAGKPPYRVLAGRAHYSVATLAAAAAGQTLPTLEVTLGFAVACGGEPGEWEARWHAVAAELAQQTSAPDGQDGVAGAAPYVGLAAFQAGDAARFYGRDRLVQQVLAQLREQRCLALVGASGCGKSSVLRAGLMPQFPGPSLVFTPGPHPLEACAAHVASMIGGSAQQVHADLVEEPRALHRTVLQALADQPPGQDLLIVVDQLEELFTLCRDHSERARFLDTLFTAACTDNSRVRVVFGLRADFSAHCTDHPDLFTVLNGGQVLVGAMSPQELRRAISQPAIDTGGTVEAGLLATLVAEAAGQPGTLPLVSHALLQTWHRRRGNTLTLTGYQAAGGIHGALAQTAEQVYHGFDTAHQELTRQLLLRLTALGEGTEDTKRRIRRDELDTTDPGYDTVLAGLAQARLITLDNGSIEITHEALIKAWPRLRDWLTEDRDGLRTHRQLTEATAAWDSLDRDPGALYRGTRLAVAREWAQRNGHALTPREREFLGVSTNAEHREQRTTRRRIRQLRSLVAGLTVLLVITTGLAIVTRHQQQQTAQQRQIALSRQFAAQASAVVDYDVGQAIRWSLEAYHHYPTAEARSILLSLASHPAYHGFIPAINNSALTLHLSDDGRRLVTPLLSGRIVIYDVPERTRIGEFALLDDYDPTIDEIPTTALSPDGQQLIHLSSGGDLYVWDLANREQIAQIRTRDPDLTDVTFSPDGSVIASVNVRGAVTLWDSTTLRRITSWLGDIKNVKHFEIDFSPDGKTLATAGGGQVILRDLATGKAHPLLRDDLELHGQLTFSPDSKTLAIRNQDDGIIVWSTITRAQTAFLEYGDRSGSIAFNKYDGSLIAVGPRESVVWYSKGGRVTGGFGNKIPLHPGRGSIGHFDTGSDGTVAVVTSRGIELWDSSRLLPHLTPDLIGPISFHPSRDNLLATDYRTSIFEWGSGSYRSPVRRDLGVSARVDSPQERSGSLSADGSVLATRLSARNIAIVDLQHATLKSELSTPNAGTNDRYVLVLSPRGDRLAMTTHDFRSITVWDVSKQRLLAEIPAQSRDGTASVGFAVSRRHLAVYTRYDSQITVWNIDTQARIAELSGDLHGLPYSQIYSVDGIDGLSYSERYAAGGLAYSPDGRLMATVHSGGTVKLWDTGNYDQVAEFSSVADAISSIAFSRDSRLLAIASGDEAISIWDTVTRERWATMTGHVGSVQDLTWNKDGTTLAGTFWKPNVTAVTATATTTTWTTNTEQATQHLCHILLHDFPANSDPPPAGCSARQHNN